MGVLVTCTGDHRITLLGSTSVVDGLADLVECDVVVLRAQCTLVEVANLLVLSNEDDHRSIITVP